MIQLACGGLRTQITFSAINKNFIKTFVKDDAWYILMTLNRKHTKPFVVLIFSEILFLGPYCQSFSSEKHVVNRTQKHT